MSIFEMKKVSMAFLTTLAYFAMSAGMVLTDCIEPPNANEIKGYLMGKIQEEYMGDMSFAVVPEYLHAMKERLTHAFGETPKQDRKGYQTYIYGERNCHKLKNAVKVAKKINNNTANLATCPWYVVQDFNEDRIPTTIMKTRCSCRYCFTANSACVLAGNCEKKGDCAEVNTYIPVIRRICDRKVNEYRYVIDLEAVPVGCTCKRCLPTNEVPQG